MSSINLAAISTTLLSSCRLQKQQQQQHQQHPHQQMKNQKKEICQFSSSVQKQLINKEVHRKCVEGIQNIKLKVSGDIRAQITK